MRDQPDELKSELIHAESNLNARAMNHADEVAIAGWLKSLIGILSKRSTTSTDDTQELFAAFHDSAGRINCSAIDNDYGALLLEAAADYDQLVHLRPELLKHAHWRAQWFAQAATAGGEGIARSAHVKRIEAKLRPQS